MHRIGIIGDHNSVLGFKAVGLDTFSCTTAEEARRTLSRLAKDGYAIIFITEGFAKDIREAMDKYKYQQLPIVVPIPGMDGSHGVGAEILKKSVERAVGADIIYGGDKS